MLDRFPIEGKRRLLPLASAFLAIGPEPTGREFHAFAVGLPRSGTHSLAAIFDSNHSAAHEPMAGLTIDFALAYATGALNGSVARRLLKARDRRLGLELEASHFLHLVSDQLAVTFPDALFLLTVREPIDWLRSEINQELRTVGVRAYEKLAAYRYGRYNLTHSAVERKVIDSPRIYPFEAYFRYWGEHIERVVDSVPECRLLILPTEELSDSIARIASFVSADLSQLDGDRKHQNAWKSYHLDPAERLPDGYLAELAAKWCDPVHKRILEI